MDELYQKLATLKSFNLLGDRRNLDEKTSFQVIEGWLNHATGQVRHEGKTVESDALATWLARTSTVETRNEKQIRQSLVLRLVFVNVDFSERTVMLAQSVQQALLQAFGLELAHGYSQSCITGVSAIPPVEEQPDHKSYSFCFLPKIVSVWSHSRARAPEDLDGQYITQGLMFVSAKEGAILAKLLAESWNVHLYRTAMLPPLLFSLLLLRGVYETENKVKEAVRETEEFTGHHVFKTRRHESHAAEKATAEFAEKYAKVSGHATQLSSAERKAKMVETLLQFIKSDLDRGQDDYDFTSTGRLNLGEHVRALQSRLAMLRVDMDYTLKRVQVQSNALACMISQSDSLANIRLAKAQTELAFHNYRDSSSMKTLAIVTMFFLPGSFISALFSTNLFDWDAVAAEEGSMGVPTTPQFKLYWLISILLTLATFMLYYLWLWLEKRRREKRHGETSPADDDKVSLSEKGTL